MILIIHSALPLLVCYFLFLPSSLAYATVIYGASRMVFFLNSLNRFPEELFFLSTDS